MKQDDRAEIALAATAGDRYLAQTHEVLNQPAALVDYNLYTTDRALQDAVAIQGGAGCGGGAAGFRRQARVRRFSRTGRASQPLSSGTRYA